METPELNVVTGAFSYTGKYITQRLLAMGKEVRTLTAHPNRPHPFGERVRVSAFNFDRPSELTNTLQGATTLYNTYWVRFAYGAVNFERAIANTKTLLKAAQAAGVCRIVHISITNASEASPLPYFRGKGVVEQAVLDSGLTYAIIRPTVIFGAEDILINNIAWLLRKFPMFVVPGIGDYRLQPVYVEDLAEIAVCAGQQQKNQIMDAVGPEVYSFDELVHLIAEKIHSRAKIIHLPPRWALWLSRWIGYAVKDVLITQDELFGLMSNLLLSSAPPTGQTCFSLWLAENADRLGTQYASELDRHYR